MHALGRQPPSSATCSSSTSSCAFCSAAHRPPPPARPIRTAAAPPTTSAPVRASAAATVVRARREGAAGARAATAAATAAPGGDMGSAAPFSSGRTTLTSYLTQQGLHPHMVILMQALQTATKIIAAEIAVGGADLGGALSGSSSGQGDRDAPRKLDVVANDVFKSALAATNVVGIMASEEDEEPSVVDAHDPSKFVVVFDPLDGSSNISASIPTGTIVGAYKRSPGGGAGEAEVLRDVLQPGQQQVAAAYSLYSSATMIVLSVGSGTHGFTLLPSIGEFVLTHENIRVPSRGQMYSLNDARFGDWPAGLQRYIRDVQQGKGQSGKQYSARYICSLVADFHRTLLYGGWAGNPRSHLRLVYEANPLSFLCEQAGGRGSDGKTRILGIQPSKLHQRLPLFMGSPEDIAELEGYGDVQQGAKKYEV